MKKQEKNKKTHFFYFLLGVNQFPNVISILNVIKPKMNEDIKGQIEKYFLKELNYLQKSNLFEKIVSSPELRDEFARLQNCWALAASSSDANDKRIALQHLREFKKMRSRKRVASFFIGLSKYAAILVVGMLLTKFYSQKSSDTMEMPDIAYQTLSVPAGQRAHLILADGTNIWVNNKSTLVYPGTFTDSREITLSGEAYFEVAENDAPFIVNSGNFRTQVTGTKFYVLASNEIFDVTLIEGQVKVYDAENAKDTVVLNPNERVSLTEGILQKKTITYMDDFLWEEGIYVFDDLTFAAIVERLQLYYDVEIHVENRILLKYKFTGKFRLRDGINNVLNVLQMGYPFVFNISEDGNNIFIH